MVWSMQGTTEDGLNPCGPFVEREVGQSGPASEQNGTEQIRPEPSLLERGREREPPRMGRNCFHLEKTAFVPLPLLARFVPCKSKKTLRQERRTRTTPHNQRKKSSHILQDNCL